jgi:dTDP-4-amino-4,6-dideoxygalactose transaminase
VSRFEEEPTSARSTAEPPVVADPAVPFLDLTATTGAVREEIGRDIEQLLDTNAFVNGPQVGMFEAAFAAWCGVDECVGVASGLDALRLGLLGLDIGTGDEVVVPALTFIATLEAVSQAGAVPVVVDVSERDYTVDPDGLDHALSARTRALLPVHIYGQMADMRGLSELAERHGLDVVEDACQAHGAERDGIRPGHASALAGFSFYPSKNLGAFGDAGAVVTRDARLARRLRALREHGETTKYHYGWTRSRPAFSGASCRTSVPGMPNVRLRPRTTRRRLRESVTCGFRPRRRRANRCGISTSCARHTGKG